LRRTKELHRGVETISGFTLTLNHNGSIAFIRMVNKKKKCFLSLSVGNRSLDVNLAVERRKATTPFKVSVW
jgi:hypothetical protein